MMTETQWLIDMAQLCSCCPSCWGCPCGACQAGGVCDAMPCRCFGRDDSVDEPQSSDDLDAENEAP